MNLNLIFKVSTSKVALEGNPTETELEDTKTFVTGSFAGDRETPEATIGDLWLLETESLPSNYQKLFLGEVTKTSAEQVKDVSEKLIHRDGLVIVVVGEAEKIKADLEAIAPVTVINEETSKK